MAGRPLKPIPADDHSPQAAFARRLREVYLASGTTLTELAAATHFGTTVFSEAMGGQRFPTEDVLRTMVGELGADPDAWVEDLWRSRGGPQPRPVAPVTPVAPEPEPEPKPEPGTAGTTPVGVRRRWRRPAVALGVAMALGGLVAAVVAALPATSDGPPSRVVVVQNKVAVGPSRLMEDDSPSYLAAEPVRRCANRPGCKISGSDLATGDTVDAVCQVQGALLTNADDGTPGVRDNPGVAYSALWYGVDTGTGRGYISEVYLSAGSRGGLGLPPC